MSTIEWPKTHVQVNKSSFKNERIIGKSNMKQEFSKSAIERCWKSNIWDAGRKFCLCILCVRIQNAEVRWWFCILIASLDFDINFLNHNLLHTFKFGLNGVLTYIKTFWSEALHKFGPNGDPNHMRMFWSFSIKKNITKFIQDKNYEPKPIWLAP